jgi:hypothetical protein
VGKYLIKKIVLYKEVKMNKQKDKKIKKNKVSIEDNTKKSQDEYIEAKKIGRDVYYEDGVWAGYFPEPV